MLTVPSLVWEESLFMELKYAKPSPQILSKENPYIYAYIYAELWKSMVH